MMALYDDYEDGIVFWREPKNTSDRQRDLALTLMALSIHDAADLAKVEQVAAILAGDEVEPPPPPPDPELPRWKVIKDGVRVRDDVWGNVTGQKGTGDIVAEYEKKYSMASPGILPSWWIRISNDSEWICYRTGLTVLAERIP